VAEEHGVADILIDLGEVPEHGHRPADAVLRRPPIPVRPLLTLLSAVLLALLGGAVPRLPPSPPTVIPARLGDSTFVVGDRLFVATPGPELLGAKVQTKVISTYALPGARLLSLTTVAVSGSISNIRQAGDMLVVSYQVDATGEQGTVGVTADTDQVQWRRPTGLDAVSAADGLALLAAYSGQPGETRWYAVDLHTGEQRWTVREPVDGYTTVAGADGYGYPDWLVSASSAGLVEVRDARTGAIHTVATVPAAELQANSLVWIVGNLLMLGTGSDGVTAYGLPDLGKQWYTAVDLSENWAMTGCGPVICAFRAQRRMSALDPATGRLLWDSERWAYAEPSGADLVAVSNEVSSDSGRPKLTVLDPRTGAVRGDFGEWQGLATSGSDELSYGMRTVPGKFTLFYGVLDPARLDVRLLGAADQVSGDCETSAGVLVCRLVDASVAVWRLG
jgi:hypothetical protein